MKIKGTNISIALIVLGVMAVLIVVIRLSPNFQQQQQYVLPSFEEFSKNYIPSTDSIANGRKARLGSSELLSQQLSVATPDGQTIQMYVSKPKGDGPFPVVAMLHDGPSSTKVSRELSLSLGEAIMQQYQVIALSVDRRDSSSADNEIIDLASALDELEEYREVDEQSMALFGDGRGAHTILHLLQISRDAGTQSVDGVFLLNPYSNPAAVWEHQRLNDEKESSFFPAYYGCDSKGTVDSDVINTCLVTYILQAGTRIEAPMTIVTTTNNSRVPESEISAVAALAQKDSQVTREMITTEQTSGDILGELGTPEMDALLRIIDPWMTGLLESWKTTIIPATNTNVAANENTNVNSNSSPNSNTDADSAVQVTLPQITE